MRPIHVAVAVIEDAQGQVLLSRRPEQAHQGGLWEFPGGKVEPGESVSHALLREIREELGLEVRQHRPLISVTHHYPDKSVQLDVHQVKEFSGEPLGLEGQPLAWVPKEQLTSYPMPAADRPIVTAIRLPPTYLITGPDPSRRDRFLQQLESALTRGHQLVQLRAPQLAEGEYLGLAQGAQALCRRHGAWLLLNAPPRLADRVNADGIHLNSRRLMALKARPLPADQWVAASCHNAAELRRAEELGLDFVVLSPVLRTLSHPAAETLGWEGFQTMVRQLTLPVYALGGMTSGTIEWAQHCGGQGIAAIRALWQE